MTVDDIVSEADRMELRKIGFVIVPVEPSPRMLDAASKSMSPGHRPDRWLTNREKHAVRWAAMVAAAPKEFI